MQVLFAKKNFAYSGAGLNNSHICNGLWTVTASKSKLGIYLTVVCPKIVSKESVTTVPVEFQTACGYKALWWTRHAGGL